MSTSTHPTSSFRPVDKDLAAHSPLQPAELKTARGPSNELTLSPGKGLNLKAFLLSPDMLTFSGVFYPTGYVVVMFPNVQLAEQAAQELLSGGYDGQAIMLLSPETLLREIAPVDGESDNELPSIGTESATAQKYVKLARAGQYGLMVHAESEKDTEVVMSVVRSRQFSYAEKYHMLVMEDLK